MLWFEFEGRDRDKNEEVDAQELDREGDINDDDALEQHSVTSNDTPQLP